MADKKVNKIWFIIAFIPFVLGLFGGLFYMFNKNNVNASSSTFIEQNEYTISFRGFPFTLVDDEDTGYLASSIFLSFSGTSTVQITLPRVMTLAGEDFNYQTITLPKQTGTRYRTTNTYNVAFYSDLEYVVNYGNPNTENSLVNYPISQIDFYFLGGEFSELMNCTRILGYSYSTYPTVKRYYGFYAGSTKLAELYLTCPQFVRTSDDGDRIEDYDIVKIDRSEYVKVVKETETIYIDGVSDLKSFYTTIKTGVSNFLGIKLFGDFTLGHTFAILFSFAGFTFLLHVILK